MPPGTEKLSVEERQRGCYRKCWSERTEVQTEVAENRCLATALQSHAQTNSVTDGSLTGTGHCLSSQHEEKRFKITQVLKDSNGLFALVNHELTIIFTSFINL